MNNKQLTALKKEEKQLYTKKVKTKTPKYQ